MNRSVVIWTLLATLVNAVGAQPRMGLPRPSGPYGIGRLRFDWVDQSRRADMAPNAAAHAELMVYVWYPTNKPAMGDSGVLLPGAMQIDADPTVSNEVKAQIFGGSWARVLSGAISSHAVEGAAIVSRPKRFPVVIYSPGAFMSSFQATGAIEDLVSHGYIVASIEHLYETFAVAMPDGVVIAYSPKNIQAEFLPRAGSDKSEFDRRLMDWSRHRADVRAADISFVMDKLLLLETERSSNISGHLDLVHVAAVGHSRGGWAAIIACRRDPRFAACVNEDGSAEGEGLQFPGTREPTQPVLYVEVPPKLPEDWTVLKENGLTADEWIQKWHKAVCQEFKKFPAGGEFVELARPGLTHYSFTDEVLLHAAKETNLQDYHAAVEGLLLTEDVVRRFLDEKLKNKQNELRTTPAMKVKRFPSIRTSKVLRMRGQVGSTKQSKAY